MWRLACAPVCACLCALLARRERRSVWWAATLGWLGGLGALPLIWTMKFGPRSALPDLGLGGDHLAPTPETLLEARQRGLREAATCAGFLAVFILSWTVYLMAHIWDTLWPQSPQSYELQMRSLGTWLQWLHPTLELFLPSVIYLTLCQREMRGKLSLAGATAGLLGLWCTTLLFWWVLPVVAAWRFGEPW